MLDTDDPQQMNGYAYANNSPVTNSDPSGLYWKTISVAQRVAITTFVWAAYVIGLMVPILMLVAVVYWIVQVFVYRVWIEPPWRGSGGVTKQQAAKEAGLSEQEYQEAKNVAADKRSWVDVAIQIGGDVLQEIIGVKGIIDNCIKDFNLINCGFEVFTAVPWFKVLKGGNILDKIVDAFKNAKDWTRRRDKAMADLKRVEDAERRLTSRAGCNSFVPGTPVLLADGNSKPIEQLRLGDHVLATDPDTGRTASRAVVATITGAGHKHLVDITVDTDGEAGNSTATLTATNGHPFWAPQVQTWLDADHLSPRTKLETPVGTQVQVTATRAWATTQTVHNLTVDGIVNRPGFGGDSIS
ncbi:polymorphic toxin-type HINT domain-containing protein [Actinokineospora pegani]|uniref:polymorphic toxin-type HINT domain-containing protein n=1 Tax=Actinokineospora pegani TaxID=2654637 RepID=UPI001F22B7A6|nr:polymorphic toxin-type HINT domain-containing protein [Actinokineospora pegani]